MRTVHKKVKHHLKQHQTYYVRVSSVLGCCLLLLAIFFTTRGATPHTSELSFIESSVGKVGTVLPASCESAQLGYSVQDDRNVHDCQTALWADPNPIYVGDNTNLYYTIGGLVTDPTVCVIYGSDGSTSVAYHHWWYESAVVVDPLNVGPLSQNTHYTLDCTYFFGYAHAYAETDVTVLPRNACAPNPDPVGYGTACTSPANACGQTQSNGTIQCNGSCSSTAPALPANYGATCSSTSPANSCGQTNAASGTYTCDGSCSAATPATPSEASCTVSGTLTLSPTSCTIAVGASTCTVSASWSTTNATGAYLWDRNVSSNLKTANSSGGWTVWVANPQTVFDLKNGNGVILDTKTATASCASGSTWNGSTCAALPDLTAGQATASGFSVQSGQSITVTAPVSNIGTANATTWFPNWVALHRLSGCAPNDLSCGPEYGDFIRATSIPSLGVGATTNVSATFSLNVDSVSEYSAQICANFHPSGWSYEDNNLSPLRTVFPIEELNVSNNCGPATTFTVGNVIAPDLTAGATSPATATVGQSTSFSASVSNIGTGTATNFPNMIQVATSNLTPITTVNATTLSSLAASASATVSAAYTFSAAGTYKVRTCANLNASFGGSISESNSNNNCGDWTVVTVSAACVQNQGATCTSSANTCGQTNTGTISCDGSCSAITPSSDACGCTPPLTQDITVACDVNASGQAATSGSVLRRQTKSAYPACQFGDSVYVSDTCVYPSLAAGTITSNSCTISAGQSSCAMNVVWSSSNTSGTVTVTRAYAGNSVFATGTSGTQSATFTPPGTYHLDLYDGSTKVGTGGDFTASCVANSTWNGSICVSNSCVEGAACTSAPNSCSQTNSGTMSCASGSAVCSASTPALPANFGTACSSPANSCGATTPGTYTCAGTCSETSAPPLLACGIPDLTAGPTSPVTATAGSATTFGATIINANHATGAGFTNLFQKATDASGTGAADIGTTNSSALAAGGQTTITFSYTFPSVGTFYLRVCADKSSAGNAGVITESDETNNCGDWTVVTVSSPAQPVNGVCGSTHNICTAGNSTNPNETSTQYTWTCAGLSGGANSACSESKSCVGGCGSGDSLSCSRSPAAPSLTAPATVTYTAQSSGSVSAPYVFSDALGATLQSGSLRTFTTTYSSAGSYAVSVTATGAPTPVTCGVAVTVDANNSCGTLSTTLTANPTRVSGSSGQTTLSWSATGVQASCVISATGGDTYSNTVSASSCSLASGNATRTISGQTQYCMTCDNNVSAKKCVVVNVGPVFQEF